MCSVDPEPGRRDRRWELPGSPGIPVVGHVREGLDGDPAPVPILHGASVQGTTTHGADRAQRWLGVDPHPPQVLGCGPVVLDITCTRAGTGTDPAEATGRL